MDPFEWVLHYWPILSFLIGSIGGWLIKTIVDYRKRDARDHQTLEGLVEKVDNIENDVRALKSSHITELQESLYEGHQRLVVHKDVKTLETHRRYSAIYRSLAELDDVDKTYAKLWEAIEALPIYTPEKEGLK